VSVVNKLASAYEKCLKLLFGFAKCSSVSAMLLQLGLPTISALLHNAKVGMSERIRQSKNVVVSAVGLVTIHRLTAMPGLRRSLLYVVSI